MNLFEKIARLRNNKLKPQNQYYGESNGKSKFVYRFDLVEQQSELYYSTMSIEINGTIDNIDGKQLSETLYECTVWYNNGKPSLKDSTTKSDYFGFEKVYAQFDYEKMKNDEKYTKYVCTHLLNPSRIKNLHDIAFGIIEGQSAGNYVGSVIENGDSISVQIDPVIGKIADESVEMDNLRKQYVQKKEQEAEEKLQMKAYNQQQREKARQERIVELRRELDMLTGASHENDDDIQIRRAK